MVVHLEALSLGSFGQFAPWHQCEVSSDDENAKLSTALLHATAIPVLMNQISIPPKDTGSNFNDGPALPVLDIPSPSPMSKSVRSSSPSAGEDSTSTSASRPSPPGNPSTPLSAFSFTDFISSTNFTFSFPASDTKACYRQAFKRRRPDSDVDGPNTASLGCKKRRLLRYLITSRLSLPFSLPATHILNREAVATGEKRFLKLAAMIAARRLTNTGLPAGYQNHPSPSTMLHRAAVINRFRLRVRHDAIERGDNDVAQLAVDAAMLQQGHGPSHIVGARFPVWMPGAATYPLTPTVRTSHHPAHVYHIHRTLTDARLSPPSSPGLRPSEPTAPSFGLPPSPRLRPRRSADASESQPVVNVDEDEFDDDSMAFPTSVHESRYEASDDPDDVYADFGLIFGGGEDSSDEETDHFEDVMDDVDGIPWMAR